MKDCAMTIQTFATWDWSSPTGEKSICERERETQPPQTFKPRAKKAKNAKRKTERERQKQNRTLFALEAETTTAVAEMENIFMMIISDG